MDLNDANEEVNEQIKREATAEKKGRSTPRSASAKKVTCKEKPDDEDSPPT